VQGSQSAVVVGPKGEEIFTDKYGRVKVQFHWDREGKNDEDSSCWVRVGQLAAGRRWGASHWPRIGQEVIVDFFEGDPDQPIIVGTVYNADQMPPYLGQGPDSKHKNDNKVSGFKSNTTKGGQGFNELRFDDTKDKEQVFIHAEKNLDTRVKSSSMESVGSAKHVTVAGRRTARSPASIANAPSRTSTSPSTTCSRRGPGTRSCWSAGVMEGEPPPLRRGRRLQNVDGESYSKVKGYRYTAVEGWDVLEVFGNLIIGVRESAGIRAKDHASLTAEGKATIVAPEISLGADDKNFIRIGPSGVTIVGRSSH